jgi:hypothetical protein
MVLIIMCFLDRCADIPNEVGVVKLIFYLGDVSRAEPSRVSVCVFCRLRITVYFVPMGCIPTV